DVKTTETGELWDQSLRLTEITRKLKVEAENATHFVVFAACRNRLRLTQPGSPGPACRRRDPFGLSKRTTCSSHPRWQRVSLHRTWARALVALASFVGGTKSNSTRSRARSGRLPRRGADRGREHLAERERGAAVGDWGGGLAAAALVGDGHLGIATWAIRGLQNVKRLNRELPRRPSRTRCNLC